MDKALDRIILGTLEDARARGRDDLTQTELAVTAAGFRAPNLSTTHRRLPRRCPIEPPHFSGFVILSDYSGLPPAFPIRLALNRIASRRQNTAVDLVIIR